MKLKSMMKLQASVSTCSHMSGGVFLLCVVVFLKFCSGLAVSTHSTVEFLPGFQGILPFHLETGYVGVGESEEVQLFYYFVKSERKPDKDPLFLWLTGGPGCSAWSGLVFEIGPLRYKVEQYNGSLPTLVLNPFSWTKVSSIIFVDSPVGTGFSYGRTSMASQSGDFKQVDHLLQFFRKWLINHPEFISNPFYIGGDSYSGLTVPVLVQQITKENEGGIIQSINLQGYLLGNPGTEPGEGNFAIPFAHGMALISDELYKSLEKSCGGEYINVKPSNTECQKHLQAYDKCVSGIDKAYILDPYCSFSSPKPQDGRYERRLLNEKYQAVTDSESLPTLGCREYEHLLSRYWANDPDVRQALHIRNGSIGQWQRCNFDLPYQREVHNSFPYHVKLSTIGYRSLIYSGDHDMLVPYLGTQAWIRSLNYSIVDDWRPWLVKGQVAGYTRTYSNRMTFATVKGAGHTAPQYKPEECFGMFKRWIDYEPL
ncbi:serine carboxypeptidase-like 1 [Ziziphus jujuba]|uniref:Serine carboxypeptidase-like 1 n=1 Tax=Ziziphus jujuba TaxID=326968 RepID=A0A6P4A9S8_ZIZJJ|nr:serine carboxypeptidase-like 1 [Ziziphus jujuba]